VTLVNSESVFGLPFRIWIDGVVSRLAGATAAIGVADAMVITSTSLFLANAVHTAPLMIGLFFAGRSAAEIVTDLFVGVLSDRMRRRRALLALCALLSAVGALCYLWLRNYYALFAAGAIFFGTGGACFAQLFAYTRELAEDCGYQPTSFNSALRAVNSAAWVLGPPIGFYILSRDGFTVMYGVAAIMYLVGAVLCRWGILDVAVLARPGHAARNNPFAGLTARGYLMLGAIALLLTVNTMYQIDIALYVTKGLHLGIEVPGLLVGLAAAIEIPAITMIGAKADRLGRSRVVLGSALCAVFFFLALPFAASLPALLILQIPNAIWTSVVMSIPVVMLQDDTRAGAGVGSSLYTTAFKGGILLGGSVTGISMAAFGYSGVFFVSAGVSGLAVLLLGLHTAIGKRPLCTVIVPTYNRSGLLRHTLDSLARQTLGIGRFEVIVADDGSSDDTAEVVSSYSGRLDMSYYFQADEGYRVAAARNLGIRHAQAPICVFIDSGVILHSGALAAYLQAHQRAIGPVAVCGYVYCFNEDNEDAAQIRAAINFDDPDATIASLREQRKWLDIREEFYAKYGDDFADLPAPWLVYWTCNVSAEKSQIVDAGMFDEAFRSWGTEDVDLSYRLHRRGVRFALCREASAIHVPHPKSYTDNMQSVAGNDRYFAAKYGTPITQLVVDNHFFLINDIIRKKNLPDCADYLAARSEPGEDLPVP
jgi:glycosyltransferase involved in cell wall biosynthesis/predicted MFS family arabinose efflux permease